MNIEIRKEILEQSLILEDLLSTNLQYLFEIDTNESKTLGFKGSALSFKNKVDLLVDIGKISDKDYPNFIMFMEVRNQFIHNADSNNFEIVLKRIKKKNKLISLDLNYSKFIEFYEQEGKSIEEVYSLAFTKLFLDLKDILKETGKRIIKEKQKVLEDRIEAIKKVELEKILQKLTEAIDESSDLLNKEFQKGLNTDKDFGELIRYSIRAFFEKKMKDNNKS